MGSLKNPIFRGGGGVTKNQYIGRNCLKRGGLEQFKDLGGGLGKKKGDDVFEGGSYPNAHYVFIETKLS